MPPVIKFLIRRFLAIPISLLIITMVIYAGMMLTPPETRADLYFPKTNAPLSEAQIARILENIIVKYHLRDPYPVQYAYWLKSLIQTGWGWSPTLNENVLPALLRRSPATAELTLYSILFFVPLGLLAGGLAGWKQNSAFDNSFRLLAFIATSFPPFILALLFLSIFYVNLHWFAPGRIDMMYGFQIASAGFRSFTGMFTIDSLLNGRVDIFIDSLRHLAMPVFTLSIFHWSTLARITRSTTISERHKDYVTAAQSRGLSDRKVLWRHVFWNTLAPSFTSMTLSVASLVTGVFVVEIIYNIRGVSDILVRAMQMVPDASAALGFSLYSTIMVLMVMFILDILQALFDPRLREDLVK
jgi:peptide/nickel transport system permease protein